MTTRAAWTWPTRHDGQRTVLLDMLIHGNMSRAELARRTGMSRGGLTRLSRDLTALGLVEGGGTDAPLGRGRPAERLRLHPAGAQFVGFKLTGEALYAAVIDLTGAVLVTEEQPFESRAVEDVIELMGQVVDRQRETYESVAAVGVCLAGDVRQRRGMTEMVSSYFLGWGKVPIERLIRDRTDLPIAVANDVQALAAAHHWFGAGRGTGRWCSSVSAPASASARSSTTSCCGGRVGVQARSATCRWSARAPHTTADTWAASQRS